MHDPSYIAKNTAQVWFYRSHCRTKDSMRGCRWEAAWPPLPTQGVIHSSSAAKRRGWGVVATPASDTITNRTCWGHDIGRHGRIRCRPHPCDLKGGRGGGHHSLQWLLKYVLLQYLWTPRYVRKPVLVWHDSTHGSTHDNNNGNRQIDCIDCYHLLMLRDMLLLCWILPITGYLYARARGRADSVWPSRTYVMATSQINQQYERTIAGQRQAIIIRNHL